MNLNTAVDWLEYCAAEMTRAGVFFGHGTDNAQDEAAWLLLHVLGAPFDGSFPDWDKDISEHQKSAVKDLLARRIVERRPLAYLIGAAQFCGLQFRVTADVLVPRSPLAELIVDEFSPWLNLHRYNDKSIKVLDMCTGGGCIAIAMAVHMPGIAVDAVDISSTALAIAAQNVELHDVTERVNLIESDLFSSLNHDRYDLIVSNPPYVSSDVFAQLPAEYMAEPSAGLISGEDGLDIVLKILDACPDYLHEKGILIVEVGESAMRLNELLPQLPFLWLEFRHGGEGIFLLEYEQLINYQADVKAVLELRENV